MNADIGDRAVEILRATQDGDRLAPLHLYLLQEAVNGHLSAEGLKVFEDLHRNAMQPGGYVPPWYHGIEHLTRDLEGYVYWKGVDVEHHSFIGPDAHAREKAAALMVAARCRHLEATGIPVNGLNTVWHWEKYQAGAPAECFREDKDDQN
jgi:hypothetical protein